MRPNYVRLRVESLEVRCTPSCTNVGEGVSGVAQGAPQAQADLVHVTQVLAAQNDQLFGEVVAYTAQNPDTFPGC